MAINIIVQSAEGLTALLILLLVVQVSRLYRASIGSPVRPLPTSTPRETPQPGQSTTSIMESYIDELLGGAGPVVSQPKTFEIRPEAVAPLPGKTAPLSRPADRQPYQPISLFLTRRYDASST